MLNTFIITQSMDLKAINKAVHRTYITFITSSCIFLVIPIITLHVPTPAFLWIRIREKTFSENSSRIIVVLFRRFRVVLFCHYWFINSYPNLFSHQLSFCLHRHTHIGSSLRLEVPGFIRAIISLLQGELLNTVLFPYCLYVSLPSSIL